MKQVFLSGKGEIEVLEVPAPMRLPRSVLVQNVRSLISSGTEGAAVSRRGGWLGAVEKGLQSKQRLEQVWRMARTRGLTQTWEAVQRKLEDSNPAGYSSSGVVIEVSGDDIPYRPGDRVACIGVGFANHADYVTVPLNLVSALPKTASFEEGAFGALACIALQGIRRLDLTPGEHVGVIGLGLVGQLTLQLLNALGYRAVGLDLSANRARVAEELSGVSAWGGAEGETEAQRQILQRTSGAGLDGVILCAATTSSHPVNLAFDLCRQRGRVSVVGDIGLSLDRSRMYRKELELRLSSSYGPGRYDENYEVAGHDYPLAHARWTEGRNLGLFCDLLGAGQLNLKGLVSAIHPVTDAPQAYARLKQPGTEVFGVLFDYGSPPLNPTELPASSRIVHRSVSSRVRSSEQIRLGVIGSGAFVKSVHLPNLQQLSKSFQIGGIASRSGGSAELLARRYGVAMATSDYRTLLDSPDIDAVLIATRHASHAHITVEALQAGKHVFVEKPLCLDASEGTSITQLAKELDLVVRVGFNRRFSPPLQRLRSHFASAGPRIFQCRVNIGAIAGDWSNTVAEGGRLLGEGVHFFDLCNWFAGTWPVSVRATMAGPAELTNPNAVAQFDYSDGSIGLVTYTSLGSPSAGKELFEIIGHGRLGRCDDYHSLQLFGTGVETEKYKHPDKGHRGALEEFHAAILGRLIDPIGADSHAGTVATLMARQLIASATDGATRSLVLPEVSNLST